MDTSQLMCAIKSDPSLSVAVWGVYSADQIPKHIRQGGFIVNTDVSSKPGKHWCAFYFDGFGRSEFFDSYGNPPQYYSYGFLTCLRRNSSVWTHNKTKLQGHYSNVCGQYCLYYLIHRVRGQSLCDIVTTLEKTNYVDQYVFDYILKTFPYCFAEYNCYSNNQTCVSANKMI